MKLTNEMIVELMLNGARYAARNGNMNHPEDVAGAMITAIEVIWPVLNDLREVLGSNPNIG